jgi:small subunit ribosomal protein S25e
LGGVKKKSLASMEKQQDSQETAQGQEAPAQKGKKTKEKAPPQQRKQLAFLRPSMSESEMLSALSPLRAITVYGASRALGVNASVANGVLKDLEGHGMLKRAGGSSGHGIWAVAQAK